MIIMVTSPEIKYEPEMALFAEEDGLALIYRLIDGCEAEYLILEADPSQHEKIVNYAKKYKLVKRENYILLFQK